MKFTLGINGGMTFFYKDKSAALDRLDFLFYWIFAMKTFGEIFKESRLAAQIEYEMLADYFQRNQSSHWCMPRPIRTIWNFQ
jgi:hypothetical protein